MATAARQRETELAARWMAGTWRGATLRAEDGEAYRVLFEGRRGGGAGPDFRDAVLVRADGSYCYGDIELHLRPAGWYAHGHASDSRYNGLALHVVLTRGQRDPTATPLASGRTVPLVVLGDMTAPCTTGERSGWPCAEHASPGHVAFLDRVLHAAGMARFAEHAARLEYELRVSEPAADNGWDSPNRVLWLAMAEALGYGRDRAMLRQLGVALLEKTPAPVERGALPGVERARARGLLVWHTRWQQRGPWSALEATIRAGTVRQVAKAIPSMLRVAENGAVSPSRAAIVAVNVVLPFAAAVAASHRDDALARHIRAIYEAWPGLTSNQIVREMTRTLGLSRLPRGAVAQQGLHHLWQHACREKHCERCPCAIDSHHR